MPFLVLCFLILMGVVGYFAQMNPNRVMFFVTQERGYSVSLTALILLSIAVGGALVIITSGVRQTRALYLNWTYKRRQKKESQVEDLYKRGANAFLAKRYKDATALFQKALEIHPNHLNTLLRLGEVYRAERNISEAIRLHRTAGLTDPQSLEGLWALAQDFEAAGQGEEALVPLKEIVHRDEAHLAALTAMRAIYIRLARWEAAHAISEKILKLSLSDEAQKQERALLLGIKFEQGLSLLEHGQIDAARKSFKSAVKIDKDFLPGYMGMGDSYVKDNKPEAAVTLLEKGYDLTHNPILLHRLEELCCDLGQPEKILSIYENALNKNPDDIALKFYMGKLYERLEMVDEAFDLLTEIEGRVECCPDLYKILGTLYLRRGEPRLAAEAFQKGLRSNPFVPVPYQCSQCGHQASRWSGRCAQCGQWNTYKQSFIFSEKGPASVSPFPAAKQVSTALRGEFL